MAKKNNGTDGLQSQNFTTTVDANTGDFIHTVTEQGAINMEKMSPAFEFGFACASVQDIPDTRITALADRYTFKSEDLIAINAERAAGHRLAQDVLTRAGHLANKDKALMAFWSPDKGDAEALAQRDAAHQLLLCLLDPEAVLAAHSAARLYTAEGEVVTHSINFGPAESTTQFASITYSQEGAKALSHALFLVDTTAAHWFEGRGVVFTRPVEADGKQPNAIFVNAEEVYTIVDNGKGGTKFLPFTFPKLAWQLAALMVTGHRIDVVMTDVSRYDAAIFRNRVVDQLVKEQFITTFGKLALPYTKKSFIEARYPADPIKGMLEVVAPVEVHEVFEF